MSTIPENPEKAASDDTVSPHQKSCCCHGTSASIARHHEEKAEACCRNTGKKECGCASSEIRKLQPEGSYPIKNAYSHGVVIPLAGADLLFTAGQIALDDKRNVVGINDVRKQTETIFENIKKILSSAGMGFEDVVKAQIFLTRAEDISAVKEIRNRYFEAIKPVSTMVVVSKLAHADCLVEIEVAAAHIHKKECPFSAIGNFFKKLFGCGKDNSCCCKDKKTEDRK